MGGGFQARASQHDAKFLAAIARRGVATLHILGQAVRDQLQNLVAGPVAEKLSLRSAEEVFAKEIIMAGVLSIQAGNNPRVVEMQLLSFLSTKQQALIPKAA